MKCFQNCCAVYLYQKVSKTDKTRWLNYVLFFISPIFSQSYLEVSFSLEGMPQTDLNPTPCAWPGSGLWYLNGTRIIMKLSEREPWMMKCIISCSKRREMGRWLLGGKRKPSDGGKEKDKKWSVNLWLGFTSVGQGKNPAPVCALCSKVLANKALKLCKLR